MNIVLVNPEIPFNTGNIGRTCVATNSVLHLVGRLGFSLEEKEIRRSGLDYWPKLKYKLHKNFESFLKTVKNKNDLIFFSTKAEKTFWQAPYSKNSYLIFGSESAGLPKEFYGKYKDKLFRIPVSKNVRSLNLSSSAAVVIYEALRQTGK
jgi:tRNA (cytidine/uridine-2'-O-)-methyltransferase